MPRLIGPTRLLLTAMLVAAIPLCCCRGEIWGSLLAGVSAECSESQASHGEAGHCHPQDHCAGQSGNGCGGKDREPCDDDGPCDCGRHRDVKSLPEAPASIAAGSSVLVGILPAPGAVSPANLTGGGAPASPEGAPRPPTTLLRLRCALVL